MSDAIDWSGPLVAVHEDGRRVDALYSGVVAWTTKSGAVLTCWPNELPYRGWHIENAPEPAAARTYNPAIVERMHSVVMAVAENPTMLLARAIKTEARAILAELEPADTDEAEAERIVGTIESPMGEDGFPYRVRIALAAIKRGRELAGEGK